MKAKFSLSKVFQEINDLKIKPSDSFNSIRRKFFDIMRGHGIKQGTKLPNGGVECNNPEWEVCEQLLERKIMDSYTWERCFCFKMPKDLESY